MLERGPNGTARPLAARAVELAAGAWTELGVSGWTASHASWGVDPEPLILFTGWLGDRDPRLRDEATDWCIQQWRWISRARLKNLHRRHAGDGDGFGEFAATVQSHTGVNWPGATTARPYVPSGKSVLPPLERRSLAWIRLRAIFGVGARAEILRWLLTDRGAKSAAQLAEAASYTKRNIADECEPLVRAGVLSATRVGNRFDYAIKRRAELEHFVGALPADRPNWSSLFNVVREFVAIEETGSDWTQRTAQVHVRQALTRIEPDLRQIGLADRLDAVAGLDLMPAVRDLGGRLLESWARGQWSTSSEAD